MDGCRLIAHVAKEDAAKLAILNNGGFVVSMTVKLIYDAETRSRNRGPQQAGPV